MSKVLMIAYHYPPVGFSSGVHRTLKFSQYLSEHGWEPLVLTISPHAYERTSDHQLKDIPQSIEVVRAFGFDTARHLSIMGRYPGGLALPDRWISWWVSGVISGLRLIKKHKPNVIWSTYPIATAHLIALSLHKITGIPWVSDFRDSMTEESYPANKTKRRIYRWIERKAVEHSAKSIFTTPGAVRMYAERYPDVESGHWSLIENGYDEEKFEEIEKVCGTLGVISPKKKVTLVHSGLLYPKERNPIKFFDAISSLKKQGDFSKEDFQVILRASGHEDEYAKNLVEYGIDDIVELASPVSYGDALKEMLEADGLLLFQGNSCNHQIPAKVYEYIRARRPVFAMTDASGDTADVLRDAGINAIVSLDSKDEILTGLGLFLRAIKEGSAARASSSAILKHARKNKAKELAKILNDINSKKNKE